MTANERVRRDTRKADILFMRPHEIHARRRRIFARRFLSIAAATTALTLTFWALAPTALAVAPWFSPPVGWQAVSNPKPLLGIWVHPGDAGFHQNIAAGAERTPFSATQWDEAIVPKLRSKLHQFVLGASSDASTCGRPAHYMSYSSVERSGKIIYEHITTVVSGVAFFAIYMRAATEPSLPEARNALTTLCGAQIPPQPNPASAQGSY